MIVVVVVVILVTVVTVKVAVAVIGVVRVERTDLLGRGGRAAGLRFRPGARRSVRRGERAIPAHGRRRDGLMMIDWCLMRLLLLLRLGTGRR